MPDILLSIIGTTMATTVKFKGGHTQGVLCVEAKADGSLFVSGGENGEICLWDK